MEQTDRKNPQKLCALQKRLGKRLEKTTRASDRNSCGLQQNVMFSDLGIILMYRVFHIECQNVFLFLWLYDTDRPPTILNI